MGVRAIKDERRCKLCRSEHRSEIDALLELRSNAGKLPDGRRATLEVVLEKLRELGVANPTKDNVTQHFKAHCQVVGDETMKQIADALEYTDQALKIGEKVDPDAALDRIVALGMGEIEARVQAGQKSGIPPDLVLKAIDAKTRRRSTEAQSDLLRAVGGGIAAALAGGGARPVGLPPADVEGEATDAEFEDVPA